MRRFIFKFEVWEWCKNVWYSSAISVWGKVISQSCRTIFTGYCTGIMWSRQVKHPSSSIKTVGLPAARAGCGYTVPVLCTLKNRSSCMNTRRHAMLPIRGNSWKIIRASVWQTDIRSIIPLKRRKKIWRSQSAGDIAGASSMRHWRSYREIWGNSLFCTSSWTRSVRSTVRKESFPVFHQTNGLPGVSWW